MKKPYVIPLLLSLGIAALHCGNRADTEPERQRLLQTDREFSQYSVNHGAAEAFRQYMLEDALQLPHGGLPIRGREKIFGKMMESDGLYTLSWEPQDGEVAASAEFGYTWGLYTMTVGDADGEADARISRGKYLNVWKKDSDGNWKVLVDTGNENPEGGGEYACPPCGCNGDNLVLDAPGDCPECGMELVERTDAMGEVAAIYNFHRVNDSVWTAGQPLLEHLPKLKEEGIRAVINLREHSEHEGEREAEKVLEAGMHYFNVPVNYRHPTPADADAFLRTTDEQMAEGPVFIHCTAAVRVGAFWLIRRVVRDGWTFEKALEEANAVGLNDDQHLLRFAKEYIEGVTGD